MSDEDASIHVEEEEEEDDEEEEEENEEDVENTRYARQWILEQIRRRQERLALLSESLAERGLPFSHLSATTDLVVKAMGSATKVVQQPDWVCEVATEASPKSCLIWGDAEPGTKVVRPNKAIDQWCGISALNTLRRRDPVKASRLWFDQYTLDMSRFSHEAGPVGVALAHVLESPRIVRAATLACAFVLTFIFGPFVHMLVVAVLTSSITWRQYGLWSPIAHAPLPLKLLIFRQSYLAIAHYFLLLEKHVHSLLTDLESRLFEKSAQPATPVIDDDDGPTDDDDAIDSEET